MQLKEAVTLAYKKLKSYVYNENFSLSLRIKLAEYESQDIEANLKRLTGQLAKYRNGDESAIKNYLTTIDCSIMPKSFSDNIETTTDEEFFYSNRNTRETYYIERITPFIECSIDVHIISILWIMLIGKDLDNALGDCCYGNRLYRDADKDIDLKSIKLFKKYYVNYTAWRDQGIKKAKELHKLQLDVAILNLDLKNYYNSIDFDLNSLDIPDSLLWLNRILDKIHTRYRGVLKEQKIINDKRRLLPIGLISSSILANYYLREFDKFIVDEIKPAFYGRYVDDIVFVFANAHIEEHGGNIIDMFIKEYFSRSKNGKQYFSKIDKSTYTINIEGNPLPFQQKKVKLFYFLASEPINLLEEFEKEIRNTSSEFKFEPESDDILNTFERSSYKIDYSDTINKLRSVDGITADKLGASKHLAKLINATKTSEYIDEKLKVELNDQIRSFFAGKRGLELNSLWEKVFTFYTINNSISEIISFAKDQIESIIRLDKAPNSEIKSAATINAIQKNLFYHLANCFAMATSLNISFFNDNILRRIKDLNTDNQVNKLLNLLTIQDIQMKAKNIVEANLSRQNLIYYPLINYCKQDENFDFLCKHLNTSTINYEFDPIKIKYSPRFIHYHELCLFHQFKSIFRNQAQSIPGLDQDIFKDFIEINSLRYQEEKYRRGFPSFDEFISGIDKSEGVKIRVPSRERVSKIRVGIVNLKVSSNNSINSMRTNPLLSFPRFDEINHVLNESISRQKSDLIIFPEISVPYQWLPHLTSFSKKHGIAIICGLEHISNERKFTFNYVATILPFTYNHYKNALVDLRLKKDYSPNEEQLIAGWKYKNPGKWRKAEKLRLYKWRNLQFSVFNCFELTDIQKRATFRGLVDFICTVEYNHDVNYFSNITESIARDIHSYIIQVNTSDYGDSRITQPSETKNKDLLKMKGGENISLMTGTINIHALREFQNMDYYLQEKTKTFKFTPPNFEQNRDWSKI